jgi:ubiquinone/menaquinone biosynthesis C-methylase UbiE
MIHHPPIQEEHVNAAFSKQASGFDALDAENPIIGWMRNRIRTHVLGLLKPGDTLLELNAGTGLDAAFFAEKGFSVLATDNAAGMMEALTKKASAPALNNRLQVQRCSFNELGKLTGKTFDHIFSNFGGLNCAEDLEQVVLQFAPLLNAGGMATLVIMPPVCPWEMAAAFKGNFKLAFRRFRRNGTPAHLEGVLFNTYYYSPRRVEGYFGKGYRKISLQGLGIAVPPPYKYEFARRHPSLLRALIGVESVLASRFPFHSMADHYLITMQKKS